jgi:hypothetical protein
MSRARAVLCIIAGLVVSMLAPASPAAAATAAYTCEGVQFSSAMGHEGTGSVSASGSATCVTPRGAGAAALSFSGTYAGDFGTAATGCPPFENAPIVAVEGTITITPANGDPAQSTSAKITLDTAAPGTELGSAEGVGRITLGNGPAGALQWHVSWSGATACLIENGGYSARIVGGSFTGGSPDDLVPPPPPDCSLDPPEGQICNPGPKAMFEFDGADASGRATHCEVWLYGATPPDQNGGETVQFRATNICNGPMRNVTIDTTLVDSVPETIATGPQAYCHEFATGANCGTFLMGSTGQIGGRAPGVYTLEATVRLALREGTGDPWVLVADTTPGGSAEACAPGGYVTRCRLELPITADGF